MCGCCVCECASLDHYHAYSRLAPCLAVRLAYRDRLVRAATPDSEPHILERSIRPEAELADGGIASLRATPATPDKVAPTTTTNGTDIPSAVVVAVGLER